MWPRARPEGPYRGNDTPHIHGVLAVVTPYQFKTLAEIRELLEKDLSQLDRIQRFIQHMCREDHFDNKGHQESLSALERAKSANLAGLPHVRLSQMPALYRPPAAAAPKVSLWGGALTEERRAAVDAEAVTFKRAYEAHVQHVFSHVQHHWHREEDGARVPHPYCRKKGGRVTKKGKRKSTVGMRRASKTFR